MRFEIVTQDVGKILPMPNPGLSDETIAQTIGAVERALREGYRPPNQARRGARSAVMRAADLLTEIERRLVPDSQIEKKPVRLLPMRHMTATLCLTLAVLLGSVGVVYALDPGDLKRC